MEIKKLFFGIIATTAFVSCSSQISISKVNKPAKMVFKEEMKQELIRSKQYEESDPNMGKKIVESETFYFDNKIKLRNRIIDSLKILQNKKFIILDFISDNNGRRVELSYYFFDGKIIIAGYKIDNNVKNGVVIDTKFIPFVENTTEEDLTNNAMYALSIYKHFNKDDFRSNLDFKCALGQYMTAYVTLVEDINVEYYNVSAREKCKILKLNY